MLKKMIKQKTKFKQTEIGKIPEDWEEKPLSEVVEIIGGGTPKTGNLNYWNGEIPWISVVDFVGHRRWIYDTQKHITQEGLDKSSTKLLKKGWLIISARGTVGEIGQLTREMAFNQSCYGINAKEYLINDFLYYLLKFNINKIRSVGHGAVFNTITIDTFKNILVSLPPIPEQHSIASILSSLDAKIELNNKMNKNLEAIGQALFKKWFIDNPKMEGWETYTLNDVCSIKGGTTPDTKKEEYWTRGNIAWCTPKDLSNLHSPFLLETERKITSAGLKAISSGLLPRGTLLLSSRAPIGYMAISEIPVSINQGFIAIVCDKGISNYFMLNWIKEKMETIKGVANGSTFQEVNKTNFRRIDLIKPDNESLKKFDRIATSIYLRMIQNEKESQNLSQIRDALLPKLMNGEIRVK